MFIYNTTFLIDPAEAEDFIVRMRDEIIPGLTEAVSSELRPRLMRVAAIPADPDFTNQACSISLQLQFPNFQKAQREGEILLHPLIEKITLLYGPERAMTFSTILEEIELGK